MSICKNCGKQTLRKARFCSPVCYYKYQTEKLKADKVETFVECCKVTAEQGLLRGLGGGRVR